MLSSADRWSTARAVAFLAAVFALTLGVTLPFAVMAAAKPGEAVVLCSAEGPRTVQVGADMDGPAGDTHPAKCAACVMPIASALPPTPVAALAPPPAAPRAERSPGPAAALSPPARAPPRPPSTAPPRA